MTTSYVHRTYIEKRYDMIECVHKGLPNLRYDFITTRNFIKFCHKLSLRQIVKKEMDPLANKGIYGRIVR